MAAASTKLLNRWAETVQTSVNFRDTTLPNSRRTAVWVAYRRTDTPIFTPKTSTRTTSALKVKTSEILSTTRRISITTVDTTTMAGTTTTVDTIRLIRAPAITLMVPVPTAITEERTAIIHMVPTVIIIMVFMDIRAAGVVRVWKQACGHAWA